MPVVLRVDFNVPLKDGEVTDDARIRAALPAIQHLREAGARIVACSHLGRPKGADPATSRAPVSARLGELIGERVHQAPQVIGPEARRGAARLEPGEILVLENTRWESGETKNDPQLAEQLAELGDAFVLDAFGSAHRAHASTAGIAQYLPSYAGPLLEKEVTTLRGVIESPDRPLVVVLGGAKVTDKVKLIERFLDIADSVLIGGAMCFSFFRAEGIETGDSLVEDAGVTMAGLAMAKAEDSKCELLLPVDLVTGEEFSAETAVSEVDGRDVPHGSMGLDI